MKALIDHLGCVPETCVWELTRACNLRCGHCGSAAGRPRPNELTTDEATDVARQLARLGNRLTTLSGGEPTMRKDWPDIARALIEAGVLVNMVTNGQCDGFELAKLAKDTGLANVAVSIDGCEPTHDWLRAHGAFARAADTIRHLVLAGIWVDVMFTVNRVNLAELVDVWELAQRLGAKRFRVQLGKPMGNQTHRADLTLRPEDLLSLLPLLGRLATRPGPEVRIGDSIGYFSPEERVLRGRYCDQGHWTGCYAGVRAIGIQADGGVKGCLSLQPRANEADPFVEGNLHQESLESIWCRPTAFAYNRYFTRGQLKGNCASCSHASLCRGGATCVAYSYSGSIGCDPMCYYQVAGLSEATRQRVWPVSASAAATAVLMSIGGCGGEVGGGAASGGSASSGSGSLVGGSAGQSTTGVPSGGASVTPVPKGGATSNTTGGVSMVLDYGVIMPAGGKNQGVGGASIAPDYGVPVTSGGTGGKSSSTYNTGGMSVTPDYGVIVNTGGTAGKSSTTKSSGGAIITPDYGVIVPTGGASSSGGAVVAPDYGVIVPSGGTGSGGTKASAGTSGTTNTAGSAGTSSNPCRSVCCMCDYGIIDPALYQTCCSGSWV